MPSRTEALSVTCPACGSRRTEPCLRADGSYRTAQHMERHQLFAQQRQFIESLFGKKRKPKGSMARHTKKSLVIQEQEAKQS